MLHRQAGRQAETEMTETVEVVGFVSNRLHCFQTTIPYPNGLEVVSVETETIFDFSPS